MIFISFGGLTKIASVAEEVKNPQRTIKIGMLSAFFIVSITYILVIFVTVGLLNSSQFKNTLTPISEAAGQLFGFPGFIVLLIAGMFAFITTANAGLLAASRDPMAMGKDQLLPGFFAKISKRGTPTFSILFTSFFMIFVILFLDIESLVKTASLLKILLFLIYLKH